MNGVEENLSYLQSIGNRILKREVFLECRGLKVYEDELKRGKRGGKIGLWLEYISKVKSNILMIREGSYHDMDYISDENDLNREISLENVELGEVERLNLGNLDLNLLYKYDYCLVVVRRALNWSSYREVSIWKEYLSLLEEYELFLENKLGRGLINLSVSDEYESCLKSCNDVDLWLGYSRYLFKNRIEFTRSRHILDRSLRSLPLKTHHRIWSQYLEYISNLDIPILSISVLRRFLLFSFKDGIEPYLQALVKGDKITECLNELLRLIRRRMELDYSVFKSGIEVSGSRHKISGMDDLFNLALIMVSENVLILDGKAIEDYTMELMDEKLGESRNGSGVVFSSLLNRIETNLSSDKNNTSASQVDTLNLNNRGYKLTFGELVCRVSQIYMKLANWKKVYEIYYFGIERCTNVYDFTVIYDSMMMFSSIYMNRLLSNREDSASCNTQLSDSPPFISSLKELSEEPLRKEFERLEKIVNDHSCLLYKTLVRCEKNNVSRWIEYISAFIKEERKKNKPEPSIDVVKLFEEAATTIDFDQIKDKSRCVFWVFYANYMTSSVDNGNEILEYNSDDQGRRQRGLLDLSREIFERALMKPYIEDYTLLWTEWVEMELRFGNYEYALGLVRKCLGSVKEQRERHKTMSNPRIWQLSSDIEISFGTSESVWSLIEELFDSGMPTCSLIISFGDYFKKKGLYDETFTLYERAIGALEMPFSFNIFLDLIDSFMYCHCGTTIQKLFDVDKETEQITESIGNSRTERLREIFEYSMSALSEWKQKLRIKELDCYYEYLFILYSIYGAYETRMGRKKRAYNVFEETIKQLDEKDKYKVIVYIRWINLTLRCSDVAYTRSIFDSAIENLKTADIIIKVCLKYANFELNMGEINRVRSVFVYASEFVPKIYLQEKYFTLYKKFWTSWNYFEGEYGNEDTLRDLLRVQKNVPLVSGHSVYSNSSNKVVGDCENKTRVSTEHIDDEVDGDLREAEREDETVMRGAGADAGEMPGIPQVPGLGREELVLGGLASTERRGPFGVIDDANFKNYQNDNEDEEQVSDQEYDASNTFVETDSDDDLLLSLSSDDNSGDESAGIHNNGGNGSSHGTRGSNNNHSLSLIQNASSSSNSAFYRNTQ
ncbi:hypothetical protein FG386_000483 [Cryptosporidium ryanae]|uniref:uncharacterized protein n=1 Tax=Cryptosporidium ryanae TaxID=515981 RepID=UPI00351A4EAC|nr:hypothetical protein FG386_000483 [Cryptosporidium ryanae]